MSPQAPNGTSELLIDAAMKCFADSGATWATMGLVALASGTIGEWAAERKTAVDEAVPRIIERLRPKYGRMYNFDDAQPGNVRLMAMAIQPTLPNR